MIRLGPGTEASPWRVTVGVVSFRHARFVRTALETTMAQEPCAVIVADDASDDGTQDVIRSWYEELEPAERARVTLLLATENRGLPATLNAVIAHVETPFFAYLAGDDWHLENRLTRQADHLETTGAGLSYGDALRADAEGEVHSETFYELHTEWWTKTSTTDPLATFLTTGNWIPAPTVMVRIAALHEIGGFDEEIAYEDFDAYTRIAVGWEVVHLDGPPLAVHREVGSSLGSALFTGGSLRWIEGQARTELKVLGLRPDLDPALAGKIFHRVVTASQLGADPRWVASSLDMILPHLRGRARLSWIRHRARVAARALVLPISRSDETT